MSHARKYHEPGVGSRTGMQIAEDAFDLDEYFQAGRRALIGLERNSLARSSVSSIASNSSPVAIMKVQQKLNISRPSIASNVGGSSMMIEQSPPPSPRTTLRKSVTQFNNSSGTGGRSSTSFAYEIEPAATAQYDDGDYGNNDTFEDHDLTPTKSDYIKSNRSSNFEKSRTRISGISSRKSENSSFISSSPSKMIQSPRLSGISTVSENSSADNIRSSFIRQDSIISEDDENVPIVYSSPMRPPPISDLTYISERPESEPPLSSSPTGPPPMMSEYTGGNYDEEYDDNEVDVERSAIRSRVFSEKDGNISRSTTSTIKSQSMKVKKISKKRTKNNFADDEDYDLKRQAKQPKTRTKIAPNGEVIEKIPSSHHRRMQEDDEDGENGVRRGSRYRYKPLEYWRGERARFGRLSLPKSKENGGENQDGQGGVSVGDDTIDADAFEDYVLAAPPPVVVLKEIIRIPRAEGEGTFSGLKLPKKKTDQKVNRKGKQGTPISNEIDPTKPTRNYEDGWDKETKTHSKVFDVFTSSEIEKQIACTSDQLRPRMATGSTFGFEKVFVIEEFMATGVLFLLVEGKKPLKNSKDNYYTFTVLEGCVEVQIHHSTFIIAPQGMFFIPRGNDYSITNISKRVARLAFTQAKSSESVTKVANSSSIAK